MKQKILKDQDRINFIKRKVASPDPYKNTQQQGNDLIFTNLRDSFAPFNQPCINIIIFNFKLRFSIVYGDTTMKERMTINNPNEQTQKFNNLSKEYDLLKSKYDNVVLENSILSRTKEQMQMPPRVMIF